MSKKLQGQTITPKARLKETRKRPPAIIAFLNSVRFRPVRLVVRFLFGVSVFLKRKLRKTRPAALTAKTTLLLMHRAANHWQRPCRRGIHVYYCAVDLPTHQQCPSRPQSVLYKRDDHGQCVGCVQKEVVAPTYLAQGLNV
jgi:hypothetical protein